MSGRYGFIFWADAPPIGYDAGDQLLVSLTINDLAEAYAEIMDEGPPWEALPPEIKEDFIEAVAAYSVPLTDIFDAVCYRHKEWAAARALLENGYIHLPEEDAWWEILNCRSS